MTGYIPRWKTQRLRLVLEAMPVAVLTGMRQVGKTTLLRQEFPDWTYYDLDDPDVFLMAREQGRRLLAAPRVVLDEVQKMPELLNLTKVMVDQGKVERVILSGSANLLLMGKVTESLAGRAGYVELQPMTWREAQRLPPTKMIETLLQGGLPDASDRPATPSEGHDLFYLWRGMLPPLLRFHPGQEALVREWWRGYLRTYLERDLRSLSAVTSLPDFRRTMMWVAAATGSPLNEAHLSRELGLARTTVHRWLNLMEVSGVVHRIPGYFSSPTKRLRKRPKVYFSDSGLSMAAAGIPSPGQVQERGLVGPLLETYVAHALRVYAEMLTPSAYVYYWQAVQRHEVDFLLEWNGHLLPVEVKARTEVQYRDFRSIEAFRKRFPQAKAGVVIYMGAEPRAFGPDLWAFPWWWL